MSRLQELGNEGFLHKRSGTHTKEAVRTEQCGRDPQKFLVLKSGARENVGNRIQKLLVSSAALDPEFGRTVLVQPHGEELIYN